MKKEKHVCSLWWVISLAVMLCTVAAILVGLSGKTFYLVDITALTSPAWQVLDCVQAGDFDALEDLLYTHPQLNGPSNAGDSPAEILWEAYLESLHFQLPETFSQNGETLELDVQVDCLDLNTVIAQMQVLAAEGRPSRNSSLNDIATQVLSSTLPLSQQKIKLQLMQDDGVWRVVLNDSLIELLSGFVTETE